MGEQKPEGRNVGLSTGLEPCPRCLAAVSISQSAGGRGCTDSTSYEVQCSGCKHIEYEFPLNCSGRRRDAIAEWNRFSKKTRKLGSNPSFPSPEFTMNAPVAAPTFTPSIDLRQLAFRRLTADGVELAPDITEGHAITHYPAIGLMIDVRKPRSVKSLKQAHQAAAKVDLLGRKGDWVVGEDVETAVLVNRAFREPAVNPQAAPNMPSGGWIYTATELKGSQGRVWFVGLCDGDVLWYGDDDVGLVVPVLRVPASQ